MTTLTSISITGAVTVEESADGLMAVTPSGNIICTPTTWILHNSNPERDNEISLYAIHALLEHHLAKVAKAIDEAHAKRVTVQKRPEEMQ